MSSNERSLLLLGSAGHVGSAIGAKLAETYEITGLDLRESPDPPRAYRADVRDPETLSELADRRFDVVLIALPADVGEAALDNVVAKHARDALVVDCFSEKAWFARLRATRLPDTPHIGLHLLFAPSVEWEGQNALVTGDPSDDPRASLLVGELERRGVTVHVVDAEAHDGLMGAVQVAVHASVAAYARFLVDQGIDFELLHAASTPAARILWAMAARVLENGPEVYWEIQRYNGRAPDARRRLEEAVRRIGELAEEGEDRPFGGLFDELRDVFGEHLDGYTELARSLFEHPKPSG